MDKWILRKHTRAIENVIYRLKVFKIISDKYTNRRNAETEEIHKQKKQVWFKVQFDKWNILIMNLRRLWNRSNKEAIKRYFQNQGKDLKYHQIHTNQLKLI